jgi:hypothetical protein
MLPDPKDLVRALSALAAQVGALGRAPYVPVRGLVSGGRTAVLPAPSLVLVGADGRAVAWYRDGRPFVLHPSLVDLMGMHGLVQRLAAAA